MLWRVNVSGVLSWWRPLILRRKTVAAAVRAQFEQDIKDLTKLQVMVWERREGDLRHALALFIEERQAALKQMAEHGE